MASWLFCDLAFQGQKHVRRPAGNKIDMLSHQVVGGVLVSGLYRVCNAAMLNDRPLHAPWLRRYMTAISIEAVAQLPAFLLQEFIA